MDSQTVNLKDIISTHQDFPKKGILFRDFAPLLANPEALGYIADQIQKKFPADSVDMMAGIESRGFILGTLLAMKYDVGFAMIRKAGKTPGRTYKMSYSLEYGTDTIEMRHDAVKAGSRVLICDDLLATGGTARAAADLIEKAGAKVAGLAFIIELEALQGRRKIVDYNTESLVVY